MRQGARTVVFSLVIAWSATAAAQPVPAASPIFRFEAEHFWLNLHHFLYVLGRAEAKMPDAGRRAVAGARAEQARGLERLSADERQAWTAIVSAYASGPSRQDILFDRGLVAATNRLAALAGETVPEDGVLAAIGPHLNRAAPLFRKAWWPTHRDANRAWVRETSVHLDRHGPRVLDFLRRTYGIAWPADGQRIYVAAFTNWAGAYSVVGGVVMIASTDEGARGLRGMESAFHEAMHQGDDAIAAALEGHARTLSVKVPFWLSHAILFYTAGAAVRSAVPDYAPYAQAEGIWERNGKPFKPVLDELWAPYLAGKTTRDEALAAILKRTGVAR